MEIAVDKAAWITRAPPDA